MLLLLSNVDLDRSSRNHKHFTPTTGPSHWHEEFPVAKGKRQSPIDIQTARAVLDEKLRSKVKKKRY